MPPSTSSYILGGSTLVLQQFEKMTSLVPTPYVGTAINLTLQIVEAIQTISDNNKKCQDLLTQLGRLMVVALKPWIQVGDADVPESLTTSLEKLLKWLTSIYEKLIKLKGAKWYQQLLLAKERTQLVADCNEDMKAAVAFFQVESEIDAAMSADALRKELIQVHEVVGVVAEDVRYIRRRILTVGSNELNCPSVSTTLPSRPEVLFGRDREVATIVERLTTTSDGRFAILGPGGIGKTSVALAVAADPCITQKFEDRIFWVPCAEAGSIPILEELIARSVGIAPGTSNSDHAGAILKALGRRKLEGPSLLLLDNFETAWDILGKQSTVEELLRQVASVPGVTLLLTMRGEIPPSTGLMRWTNPLLCTISALALDAARELYISIDTGASEDLALDDLLLEMACMPLAVRLLAIRGSHGECPTDLLSLWRSGRPAGKKMLQHAPMDRLMSVDYSIELSLQSHLVQQDPNAPSLLRILAELPGGARYDFIATLVGSGGGIEDVYGSLAILLQAALVQKSPAATTTTTTKHISILSPIRSLIRQKYPLREEDAESMYSAYDALVQQYASEPGEAKHLAAMTILGFERSNLHSLLLQRLRAPRPSVSCIVAACQFSLHQNWLLPQTDIVELAVQASRNLPDPILLARCLKAASEAYVQSSRLGDAIGACAEAISLFGRHDVKETAYCYLTLGSCYRLLERADDALGATLAALEIFQTADDTLGTANSLLKLSVLYSVSGMAREAVDVGNRALQLHRQVSNRHGVASCLQTIADAYRLLAQHDDAIETGEEALSLFSEMRDTRGMAFCLLTLGFAYTARSEFDDAEVAASRALELLKEHDNQRAMASALLCLCNVYAQQDLVAKALGCAERAEAILQRTGPVSQLAVAEVMLGALRRTIGTGL